MLSKLKNLRGKKEGTLAWNTLMLYILTFSSTLLSLIIYQREGDILQPAGLGLLGVASAIAGYVELFIGFGFMQSATEEVSRNRNDHDRLNVIMTSVTISKLFLSFVSLLVLFVLCQVIPAWRGRFGFYSLFFVFTALNALLPDYLYRGMEKMTALTIRTVCIRAFSAVGIFLFLKKPEDIWIIPTLTAIGNFVALFFCFHDAKKRLNVRFCRVTAADVLSCMKRSSIFFLSRFATSAYSFLNTLILDLVEPAKILRGGIEMENPVRGYYTSSDKLMTTGMNALMPISDSLYPYMVKNRDYKLVKKVLLILEPIIIAFSVGMFIIAPDFMVFFFKGNEEYRPAGDVLRAMLPAAVVILPSYLCGFPLLSPMGLAKHANYSTIFGSVIHIINLAILYFSGNMNMVTLGAAMSLTQFLILGYRLAVIWRHRDRLKEHAHVDS